MEEQRVIIKDHENRKSYGVVKIKCLTQGQRVKRSLTKLAISWLIALGSAFIPVLHFVLVPSFLILGTIMFVLSFNIAQIVLPGKSQCPQCMEEFELEETRLEWPLTQICNNCCHTLTLSLDLQNEYLL